MERLIYDGLQSNAGLCRVQMQHHTWTDPAAEEHTGLTDPGHTDLAVTFTVHKRLFVELDGSFVAALAAAVFGDFSADLCGELLLRGHRVWLLQLNALQHLRLHISRLRS